MSLKGTHWIKAGQNIGHFELESVESKTVIFSNGTQKHRMTIEQKAPIYNE